MALNLIDLAKDYLTPDVVSKMAGLVGEMPAAASRPRVLVRTSLLLPTTPRKDPPGTGAPSWW